ncbi:vomeronasal type-1 receptor 4-like [Ctenodactylus gundi]
MIPENLAMGIIFISQTAVGILGNTSLLFHYSLSVLTGKSLMPKDVIIKHLTFANFLTLISRGIPQTMAEFGLKYLLNDIGCKLAVYLYRVTRGISLYTTCLLSCFQALTIGPSNARWVKVKHTATKYIGLSCSISWLVQLLLNIMITVRVTGPSNSRNNSHGFNLGYCAGFSSGSIATPLYLFLLCFTDVLGLGLMAWASGSMVRILYRHRRQVQYIHSAHQSPRASPEARATQTILMLVSTFVTFYSLSSILVFYTAFFDNPRLWLINVFLFLDACFPTFCPLLLMNSNFSASRFYLPCWNER